MADQRTMEVTPRVQEFVSLTKRGQVGRTRRILPQVLAAHGLEAKSITLLFHGENTTFDVRTDAGRYVIRVHRWDYNSSDEIRSELMYLDALAHETTINAPRVHRTLAGDTLMRVDDPKLDAPRDVVVFHWIDGRSIHKKPRTIHYAELGQLTARLHEFSRGWTPPTGFTRRRGDAEAQFFQTPAQLPVEKIDAIPPADLPLLLDARALCIERMEALEAREGARLPIHADLHLGNALARPDGMAIIDFDDMRLAHPLSDPGVTIGAARDPVRSAYIEGYREIATFSDEWEQMLPVYGLARWLTIVGWAAERAGQIAILRKYLPYYVARMTLYSRALVHDDAEAYAAAFDVPKPK